MPQVIAILWSLPLTAPLNTPRANKQTNKQTKPTNKNYNLTTCLVKVPHLRVKAIAEVFLALWIWKLCNTVSHPSKCIEAYLINKIYYVYVQISPHPTWLRWLVCTHLVFKMECCNVSVLVVTINVQNCSIVVLEKETRHKGDKKKFRQKGMGRIEMKREWGEINEAIFEVPTAVLLWCHAVSTGKYRTCFEDRSTSIFRVKHQNHGNLRLAGMEGCVFG